MENALDDLIRRMSRLPGFGPRSARRAVLHLLRHRDDLMLPLASALDDVGRQLRSCVDCGNFDTYDTCRICSSNARDRSRICVVEDIGSLWALERAGIYSGLYHVLGGVMSAIDGIGPDDLRIGVLCRRADEPQVSEIILATSATVDGQTTAHYIAEKLRVSEVIVSRLAHGVPVGGELDYLDEGTLAQAMKARRQLGG